jgi:DNA-binding response OmpR family regulator
LTNAGPGLTVLRRFVTARTTKRLASDRRKERRMGKVMVVDDADSAVTMMSTVLKSAGHVVVAYPDGEQLEEKVVTEQPDVVLLDIVLPKRNGYEILRSLKKDARTRRTPVVVVTSKNQASDRAWGLRQGADEYLAKPFTGAELLAAVKRFAH